MPPGYDVNWTAVAAAAGVGFGAMALMFAASFLLAPRRSVARKGLAYECGIEPAPHSWAQLHIRYYIFAILFLIFDVEAVFIFPWAVIFMSDKIDAVLRTPVFYEMILFVMILFFGIVYGWRKGALQWR